MKSTTTIGTIRINAHNLKAYEKTVSGWTRSKQDVSSALAVVKLFQAGNNFRYLVDMKHPRFLKGQLSSQGVAQGARIPILPNGEKLEKAFSLFSPHLRIHDQDSHDHWDVLYQNKGGTYSYVYTLAKRKAHRARKYKKVYEFEKRYSRLVSNVSKAVKSGDNVVLALHTLLNTYMRVGNEVYFKAHGHRGLTTLVKKNISIKGNVVNFKYVGKDGVPITISQKFSKSYVKSLKSLLSYKKRNEYVFPLREADFKKGFSQFCGKEFYPHIVRSHHATMIAKRFLKGKRKATKAQVSALYLSIAHDLGHKKFDKKKGEWREHPAVTVNSYIQPELVEQIEKLVR